MGIGPKGGIQTLIPGCGGWGFSTLPIVADAKTMKIDHSGVVTALNDTLMQGVPGQKVLGVHGILSLGNFIGVSPLKRHPCGGKLSGNTTIQV